MFFVSWRDFFLSCALLLLAVFLLLPGGSFLLLNTLLDADDAQVMAENAFERQNPDLDARGGRHVYFDPFAYTIEVYGYAKDGEDQVPVKKEIYRVYWWGKAARFRL